MKKQPKKDKLTIKSNPYLPKRWLRYEVWTEEKGGYATLIAAFRWRPLAARFIHSERDR